MPTASPGAVSVLDLPFYAVPGEQAAPRPVVTILPRLSDDWLSNKRVVAREHPWIDQIEARWWRMRHVWVQYQTPVTTANATVTLRANVALDELAQRWPGRVQNIDIAGVQLALDPTTWRRDETDSSIVMSGELVMPWIVRRIRVTASAQIWSSGRSDLVLAPYSRWRRRYPRRWFATAFVVLDELRRQLMRPTG